MTKQINLAFGDATNTRYNVTIDQFSYKTTIKNTLGIPFDLILSKPDWDSNIYTITRFSVKVLGDLSDFYKNNVLRIYTLGYQLGYRKILYEGLTSYTSESTFINNVTNYVYLGVDDFQIDGVDNISGIFPTYIFDENILALVPLTAQGLDNITLSTGADFIFKTRNYFNPVNLKKFDISIYGPLGNLIPLNGSPFVIVLEARLQYTNPVTSNALHNIFSSSD
jgi:hypothetical protein